MKKLLPTEKEFLISLLRSRAVWTKEAAHMFATLGIVPEREVQENKMCEAILAKITPVEEPKSKVKAKK